jgi:transcription elongation factor
MAAEQTGEPPAVFSALCQDHLKGVIYVESKREQHVADIVTGIRNVFSFKRQLVNLNEMPSVLAISKKGAALEKGAWVRVQRGPYRGDLAQARVRARMIVSHSVCGCVLCCVV